MHEGGVIEPVKQNVPSSELDRLLAENRVIVCAGSGGVGKTTMSAAIAVRAAQLGKRTLVLTVDPAKRLATALGLDMQDDSDRIVSIKGVPGSLAAAVIDSKKIFDRFVWTHAKREDLVARIMKNRLYQQLSTTLSGSQEFTALERLLQAVESGNYDLVVLDTPPTKHAMDFLTAPQRIEALFQDSITKWFMAPSDEKAPGFFASLVGRGTRTVLKSLEVLTGGQFIEELIDFFSAVRSIQQVLRQRSQAAHAALNGDSTAFIVVTSFDAAKLLEARYLQGQLQRLGYRMKGVIINRAFPTWLPENVQAPHDVDPNLFGKVLNFYQEFKDYYSVRYNLYEQFSREIDPSIAVVRIPEYQQDVYGLDDLESLARVLGETNAR